MEKYKIKKIEKYQLKWRSVKAKSEENIDSGEVGLVRGEGTQPEPSQEN